MFNPFALKRPQPAVRAQKDLRISARYRPDAEEFKVKALKNGKRLLPHDVHSHLIHVGYDVARDLAEIELFELRDHVLHDYATTLCNPGPIHAYFRRHLSGKQAGKRFEEFR